jgi:hypothetical protein
MASDAQRFLDEQWQRLIDYLDTWCTVTSATPGRIEVLLPRPGRLRGPAVILMTPDQWDDMASVMWGSLDEAAEDVRRSLEGLIEWRYLLFGDYELNPSPTPEWSVDSGFVRVDDE